ncbi:hypothetical protein RND71_038759 [Anisodus tanguticus]|uniref:Uncharacterized protein n=1 Tax=Anisodus tanguticus TaxID=243964 RepID=A0AAE1R0L3_9SOLA|nr:hypothetical protein RND71_038759 [Anisodus tanguticus]
MTESFKRLNQTKDELQIQVISLLEKTTQLELLLRQETQKQTQQSSPTPQKMDKTGVHSLMNAKRPIVSGIDTTSPVQTVAGKDSSNPLMAVTLPKSEREEASSSQNRRRLPQTLSGTSSKTRSKQTKKKTKDIEQIIKETLENLFKEKMIKDSQEPETKHVTSIELTEPVPTGNPQPILSGENEDIDHVSETSSDEEFRQSNYAQEAQDPNGYDSGMSFDSVARHNLDT